MATPYLGRGAAIGFGEEVTWGTAVSRTNWLRVTNLSIVREIEYLPRNHLGHRGATSANRRAERYKSTDNVSGTFEFEAAYDDSTLLLLKHALGAVSTTGSGPYAHAFTLAEALPAGLTIEAIYGNGSAEVFEGCMITQLTLSVEAGGIMTGSCEIIGQTSGGLVSAGTPTYSSKGAPILHHQGGNLTFDSLDDRVSSLEIVVNNNLTRRLLIGSAQTQQPVRGDFQEITITAVREYDTDDLHADFLAQTNADAAITFTGTGNNVCAFTFHNCELTSNPHAGGVTGPGIIEQTLEFVALSDGTNEGLAITVDNDNASATAN